MNKFKSFVMKMGRIVPAFALMLGMASVSQACVLWFHQPEVPEQLKQR